MLSLELVMSVFLFNRSFEFDPETSCHGCTKDTRVNIINIGLQVDMTQKHQKFDDCPPYKIGFLGLFATIVVICCGESFTLTALLTFNSEKSDILF